MNFDGLRSGEIFGRLFGFFYGPSFVAFVFAYFLRLIPADPWVGLSQWLGLALVFVALTVDVLRARLSPVWILVGVIPLFGWWLYGNRRQVPQLAIGNTDREWRAVFMPLRTDRLELTTHLTPDECASRLRAKTMRLRSPGSWFAPSSSVPMQGRVDARRFALKIRHVMTRPMMLDEAKGTFRRDGGVTTLDVRIGLSNWDRAWTAVMLGWLALLTVPFALSGRLETLWFAAFFIAMLALIIVLVRTIGRGDRARLRRILEETLEAKEA